MVLTTGTAWTIGVWIYGAATTLWTGAVCTTCLQIKFIITVWSCSMTTQYIWISYSFFSIRRNVDQSTRFYWCSFESVVRTFIRDFQFNISFFLNERTKMKMKNIKNLRWWVANGNWMSMHSVCNGNWMRDHSWLSQKDSWGSVGSSQDTGEYELKSKIFVLYWWFKCWIAEL